MKRIWQTVEVFLSSTFRDMHAERDHLVRVVFPKLRERLIPYRVEIVDIDLRWGITEEQAQSEKVIALCLQQVDECPIFFGFLGGRYGWVPEHHPDDARQQFPWIDQFRDRSVTELEIRHGASGKKHASFCLRSDATLETIPAHARAATFEEPSEELRQRLVTLKERLHSHSCSEYDARWDADEYDRPTAQSGRLVGLEQFGQLAEEQIWQAVKAYLDLPDQPPTLDLNPLDEEADLHERFLESRQRLFIGREEILQSLHDYVADETEYPCAVLGPSGIGKSATLSRFVVEYRKAHPDAYLLPHFIGATSNSPSLNAMLRRLCGELLRDLDDDQELPTDTRELAQLLAVRLYRLGQTQSVTLVLDAINELEPTEGAHSLWWLPTELPKGVKLIVSCLDDPVPTEVRTSLDKQEILAIPMSPLTDENRREMLSAIPKVSAKTLDGNQKNILLSNPATKNPLYLSVALEELRVFGSFESLNDRLQSFPDGEETLVALFDQVFERLEDEFAEELVKRVLTCLTCARRGLTDDELEDLVEDLESASDLPILLRQLRPYLQIRQLRRAFYHAKVEPAVQLRYFDRFPRLKRETHQRLARYFNDCSDDARRVEELPWHYCEGRDWNRLVDILIQPDFFFLACWMNKYEVR